MKVVLDDSGRVTSFVKTIGVFGGSFNPPHVGHVMAVTYALSVGRFDRVLVVPTFKHAFAKDETLIDFSHRFAMAKLAFKQLSNVIVSDIERELPTPSYMVNTLNNLRMGYYLTSEEKRSIFSAPDEPFQLRLILGEDCARDKLKWHKWEEIEQVAPPYILPSRDDDRVFPLLSSTDLRAALSGSPIKPPSMALDLDVSSLIPSAVLDYIKKHSLYVLHLRSPKLDRSR